MIGGQTTNYEYNRAIWQITCNSKDYCRFSANKYIAEYLVNVEKLTINGPEPTPRALQTAIFYKGYIAAFGGRNNQDTSADNYCLNDLLLLNLNTLSWQPIVVYGFTPCGR